MDKKIEFLKEENSKIEKELTELRKNVQYHKDNVDEINKKLEDIDSRVDFVTETKKKLADLEDRSPQSNLRFDRFQEETNETWEGKDSIIL